MLIQRLRQSGYRLTRPVLPRRPGLFYAVVWRIRHVWAVALRSLSARWANRWPGKLRSVP